MWSKEEEVKRIALILGLLLGALAAISGAVVAAQPPPANPSPVFQPVTPIHRPVGYAGKIIAVKPPGDWAQGGGASDSRPWPNPKQPLALPVFGTDINIMPSNETFIASNPQNPLYFISGSNAVSRAFSSNGGQTWTLTSPPGIGDPAGVYDDAGNAYFAQLSTGTCPDPAVVSRSSDGGATWGPQIQALSDASPSDHFMDKEWLAADTAVSSPFHGRIYVTANSYYAPGCNLNAYINDREMIAFSTNQGTTWSAPVALSDASHDQDQFTDPVVASDGTLYVSYQYQNCTYNCTTSFPMIQLITKSTDGGVSFSPSITVTGQPISPTGAFVGGYQYLYASSTTSGFRHNDQEIIGVSPTNPNVVYSLWTDGRWDTSFVYQSVTGQHADIAFSRSTDGGSTWSAPIKVNDTANGDGTDQFFPWMAVGSDGTIHASWMDRRAGGFPYREYYSQSTDGGLTWAANQPVADVATTPSGFIGDYSGLAVNSDNTLVLPVWTDQRSGQRVYTDRGVLPLVTPSATATGTSPSATPSPTNTATSVPPTSTATTVAPTGTPTTAPATATSGVPTATQVAASATPVAGTPTTTPTLCPITFSDVQTTDYFYEPVRYLYCHGVISGYADNTFRPYNDTTRAQMVKIVVLGFGYAIQTPAGGNYTFHDVPPTAPFWDVIETAAAHNIVSGYGCGPSGPGPCDDHNRGYFLPNNPVTRGQLSKIDVIAAGWAQINPATPTFTDVPAGSVFYTVIETAVCHGVVSGYADQTFHPYANATRGQISKIVYLSITEAPGACTVTPSTR
jgi:hypothetical protein